MVFLWWWTSGLLWKGGRTVLVLSGFHHRDLVAWFKLHEPEGSGTSYYHVMALRLGSLVVVMLISSFGDASASPMT